MRRNSDPRSPVQAATHRWWTPFLLAFIAALAFWTWQQWQLQPDAPRNSETETWVLREKPKSPAADPAKANLAAIFTTDDYPIEAIRNEEQGTSAFKLMIDRDGRVSNCEITSSSGSRALDEATCNIIEARARFTPARDSAGNATTDEYSSRIRWVLPDE